MNLELISFTLCPFVQRSVITLNFKKAAYKLTAIDLKNKPPWFLEISPLGKVPVLRVDDKVSIFESAVINEFIDETVGPALMPADPLQRALERAWIEYGSELLRSSYAMSVERDSTELERRSAKFFADLAKVEAVLGDGPYFRGQHFSLVEAAWAPLFMRLFLSPRLEGDESWKKTPRLRAWAENMVKVPAVLNSVPADFAEQYLGYCRASGSLLYNER